MVVCATQEGIALSNAVTDAACAASKIGGTLVLWGVVVCSGPVTSSSAWSCVSCIVQNNGASSWVISVAHGHVGERRDMLQLRGFSEATTYKIDNEAMLSATFTRIPY